MQGASACPSRVPRDPEPFALTWPERPPKLSTGARRTARQRGRLASGYHPLANTRTRTDGSTCGTCARLTRHQTTSRRWAKCDLYPGHEATDVRVSWPGCDLWKPRS